METKIRIVELYFSVNGLNVSSLYNVIALLAMLFRGTAYLLKTLFKII